jgi:hypothetical protein
MTMTPDDKVQLNAEEIAIMRRELGDASRFINRPLNEWDDVWKRFETSYPGIANKCKKSLRWQCPGNSDAPIVIPPGLEKYYKND